MKDIMNARRGSTPCSPIPGPLDKYSVAAAIPAQTTTPSTLCQAPPLCHTLSGRCRGKQSLCEGTNPIDWQRLLQVGGPVGLSGSLLTHAREIELWLPGLLRSDKATMHCHRQRRFFGRSTTSEEERTCHGQTEIAGTRRQRVVRYGYRILSFAVVLHSKTGQGQTLASSSNGYW